MLEWRGSRAEDRARIERLEGRLDAAMAESQKHRRRTLIVAIAGVVATILATIAPPVVNEAMRPDRPNVSVRHHWDAENDLWHPQALFESEAQEEQYLGLVDSLGIMKVPPPSDYALGFGLVSLTFSTDAETSFYISSIEASVRPVDMPEVASVWTPPGDIGSAPHSEVVLVLLQLETEEVTDQRGEPLTGGWNVRPGHAFELMSIAGMCSAEEAFEYSLIVGYSRDGETGPRTMEVGPFLVANPAAPELAAGSGPFAREGCDVPSDS